jgi:hypothetical protein
MCRAQERPPATSPPGNKTLGVREAMDVIPESKKGLQIWRLLPKKVA